MEKSDTVPKMTLKDLEASTATELRTLYEHIIGQAPPQRACRNFLLSNLAWHIQADKLKLNPTKLRSQLNKKSSKIITGQPSKYRPGTRLIREWHGNVYEVTILENGFMWDGRTYRSLTSVAVDITGTRRSGPLFFGLRTQT